MSRGFLFFWGFLDLHWQLEGIDYSDIYCILFIVVFSYFLQYCYLFIYNNNYFFLHICFFWAFLGVPLSLQPPPPPWPCCSALPSHMRHTWHGLRGAAPSPPLTCPYVRRGDWASPNHLPLGHPLPHVRVSELVNHGFFSCEGGLYRNLN